jgi:hypothetical protein
VSGTRSQNRPKLLGVLSLIFCRATTNPVIGSLSSCWDDEEGLVAVQVLTLDDILLDGLWLLSKRSLNPIHTSVFFNLSNSLGNWDSVGIVADEAVWKESNEGVVFMSLHYSKTCNFSWRNDIVGQLVHILSVLALNV